MRLIKWEKQHFPENPSRVRGYYLDIVGEKRNQEKGRGGNGTNVHSHAYSSFSGLRIMFFEPKNDVCLNKNGLKKLFLIASPNCILIDTELSH